MARSLPHNLEAEMSVLGVAFISKDQIDKICESVYEDMFYDNLTQHDARKYNREQALRVLLDVLGHEAEYLPR